MRDSTTYLLLALVLVVHLPRVQANAIKNFVLIPTTAVSLIIFTRDAHAVWLPAAKVWGFRLLVVVIVGELIQIRQHCVFGLI